MKIFCKECGRYLMTAKGTVIIDDLICSNSKCKTRLKIKVVTPNSSKEDIFYKFK